MPKYSKADKAEALARLREYLKPAAFEQLTNGNRHYTEERQKVYQIVRSVSRSGMSRAISTKVMYEGGLVCLDWAIAVACGLPLAKDQGVKIVGCGMDMGFALIEHALHEAFAVPTAVVDHEGKAHTVMRAEVSANDFRREWL